MINSNNLFLWSDNCESKRVCKINFLLLMDENRKNNYQVPIESDISAPLFKIQFVSSFKISFITSKFSG